MDFNFPFIAPNKNVSWFPQKIATFYICCKQACVIRTRIIFTWFFLIKLCVLDTNSGDVLWVPFTFARVNEIKSQKINMESKHSETKTVISSILACAIGTIILAVDIITKFFHLSTTRRSERGVLSA